MRRPGSEDPHRCERKLFHFFLLLLIKSQKGFSQGSELLHGLTKYQDFNQKIKSGTMSGKGGYFQKLSQGSETSDITSDGMGEMFEGDSANTYARKFPLVAPGSAHARPSARPPIGASRNFFLSSAAVIFVQEGVIAVFQNLHGVLSHNKIRFGVKKIVGTPHPGGLSGSLACADPGARTPIIPGGNFPRHSYFLKRVMLHFLNLTLNLDSVI